MFQEVFERIKGIPSPKEPLSREISKWIYSYHSRKDDRVVSKHIV